MLDLVLKSLGLCSLPLIAGSLPVLVRVLLEASCRTVPAGGSIPAVRLHGTGREPFPDEVSAQAGRPGLGPARCCYRRQIAPGRDPARDAGSIRGDTGTSFPSTS